MAQALGLTRFGIMIFKLKAKTISVNPKRMDPDLQIMNARKTEHIYMD